MCFTLAVTHPCGESAPSSRSFPGSPLSDQLGLPGTFSPALGWEKQTADKNTPSLPSGFTRPSAHTFTLLSCYAFSRHSSRGQPRTPETWGESQFHPFPSLVTLGKGRHLSASPVTWGVKETPLGVVVLNERICVEFSRDVAPESDFIYLFLI